MSPGAGLKSFSWRLSDLFTRGTGLYTHERSIFVNGVNYFPARLKEIIAFCQKQFPGEPLKVLDVGCGRYTHLQPITDINPPIAVYGMDIAKSELDRNEFLSNHIVHDTCSEQFRDELREFRGFFHMVISHSFLEHIPEPEITHAMINYVLKPGGFVLHSYPTLYDPIMLLGHMLPKKLAEKLLFLLEPWRKASGKFKTYYRKCRCDSKRIRQWFLSMGFDCIEYRYYYGTAYCYFVFPVQWLLDIFYLLAIQLNLGMFSSHAIVTLQKKEK